MSAAALLAAPLARARRAFVEWRVERDPKNPAWLAEEERLVARARQGDREAFGALYRAYAAPLYRRVILPRLGDPAAAEDALADTFVAVLDHIGGFTARGAGLWPWLARIAANKALDRHRQSARGGRALASFERLLDDAPAAEPGSEAEEREERRALDRRVTATLARLHPRYATAIRLRLLEERSREDCAARLEIRVPTFDVLLLRSLRAFRRAWAEPAAEEAHE